MYVCVSVCVCVCNDWGKQAWCVCVREGCYRGQEVAQPLRAPCSRVPRAADVHVFMCSCRRRHLHHLHRTADAPLPAHLTSNPGSSHPPAGQASTVRWNSLDYHRFISLFFFISFFFWSFISVRGIRYSEPYYACFGWQLLPAPCWSSDSPKSGTVHDALAETETERER